MVVLFHVISCLVLRQGTFPRSQRAHAGRIQAVRSDDGRRHDYCAPAAPAAPVAQLSRWTKENEQYTSESPIRVCHEQAAQRDGGATLPKRSTS